jgi:hypothetical protein
MNARTPLQATPVQIAWMTVGAIAHDGSTHCETCNHCQLFSEARPYGEGSANETWSECSLGKNQGDVPTDCPAYVERLKEEAWQAQGEAEMAQGAEA